MECDSWDGQGYRILQPYAEKTERVQQGEPHSSMQFRHYMSDIFNGLIAAGLSIQHVQDDPQCFSTQYAQTEPGTWSHWLTYFSAFAVLARKA
jgi:hypothetical protein